MKTSKSQSRKIVKRLSCTWNKIIACTVFLTIAVQDVFAAADPFVDATGTIESYLPSVQKLLYAIATIIALVGAFNIFHKMQNGDQDVKKTIMLVLGGCIALVALTTALPQFFGHSVTV